LPKGWRVAKARAKGLGLSQRALDIQPFYVMEIGKAAQAIERALQPGDAPLIRLNIGEPDAKAAPAVERAAQLAIARQDTAYTPALGLLALREQLSAWYARRFQLSIDPERIVLTAGASAGLLLTALALFDSGDEVLMPDPCYPCNRQFVRAADARPVLIPTQAQDRFQLSEAQVRAHWGPRTRGVLLASPSNPTGTSIHPDVLAGIDRAVTERGGVMVVDEIYLPLSFDPVYGQSALALGEHVVSVNSFSKYFGMTGWRLGWVVVPASHVAPMERLAQNLFICPSSIAQQAALACFEPESLAEFEQRRERLRQRRDAFIPALQAMGLEVPVVPDGAFYVWADASDWCRRKGLASSWELSLALLNQAHVAVTPGRDFSEHEPGRYIRFSIANDLDELMQAAQRLQHWIQTP
jgi:aspartate/methionine/tyrosine aminotransferase